MKKLYAALRVLLCCALSLSLGLPAYAGTTITYIHNDVAGSPVAASDSAGKLLWKESYYPYGEQIRHTGDSTNEVWFHGKPFDKTTGLSYFGARYYDPVIGRFMGMDSVGVDLANPHSFNRYAYGNNNPYKYTDPDGRNAVYIAKFTFRVSWQVGKEISSAYEQVYGVSIGVAVWNAIHNEVDDSSNDGAGSIGEVGTSQDGRKIPIDELKAAPDKRGNAPIGEDGHPVELHHNGQQADSPLDEMTRTEHRGKNNFKNNHDNTGQKPSNIDRSKFKQDRRDYWNKEWDSGRFEGL